VQVVEFIRSVRDGETLRTEDIQEFIGQIASGELPDYQATAYLMAVYHRGLSDEATVATTLAMRDSGEVIDLSHIQKVKVDKHSTGGVGDKISIPLAPLVAACGVPVPMISGRGLGHTGGTLDKLESIPGFQVGLSQERFCELVEELNICLIGATAKVAPADRKLYALRDVTATVDSIPLITASILSKKLSEGIDALVLDVKVGRGAFMKDEPSARKLAESLVRVGTGAGLDVKAYLTHMDHPLGTTIGNALEIRESIEILRGEGPADSTELTLALGAEMLVLGKVAGSIDEARGKLSEVISSGAGLSLFGKVIEAQGGDASVLDDLSKLPTAPQTTEVCAPRSGVVSHMDALGLGVAAMKLGAGRAKAEDVVDPAVGLELLVKPGAKIEKNQPMVRIHHRDDAAACRADVLENVVISDDYEAPASIVIDVIGS
jgi:pyrimidine-nucleoside phosphorylase